MIVTGLPRDELEPNVLCDEIVLILSQSELHLQSPFLLVEVEHLLHCPQGEPVLLMIFFREILENTKDML